MAINLDTNDIWALYNQFFADYQNVSLPMGGLTLDDANELTALITSDIYGNTKQVKPGIQIADVGCYTGLSSIILGKIAVNNNGKVFAIDWFKGSLNSNLEKAGAMFNLYEIAVKFIESFRWFNKNNLEIIQNTSKDASENFPDGFFDVIFIDADHRYRQVAEDLSLWFPKLKKGGLICGHDCEFLLTKGLATIYEKFENVDIIEVLHLGVIRAVYERFPDAKHTKMGSIWYYVRTANE